MYFQLKMMIFHCYVSLPEGISQWLVDWLVGDLPTFGKKSSTNLYITWTKRTKLPSRSLKSWSLLILGSRGVALWDITPYHCRHLIGNAFMHGSFTSATYLVQMFSSFPFQPNQTNQDLQMIMICPAPFLQTENHGGFESNPTGRCPALQGILQGHTFLHDLGGGFKYFMFSPLLEEMIQFDWYFSHGLKAPTIVKKCCWVHFSMHPSQVFSTAPLRF